ncbi:MAG: hypothetical protein RQ754_10365 [Desulfuromonadales bacterium]|nr:hypothetical protein [Desulfuromonadales bacterium]
MMRTWKMVALLLLLGSLAGTFGCSDGGSRSAGTFVTVTGSVVQGPVSGALVIADRNGNYLLDANEASTYTDENGDFNDLVIPDNYGFYVLVSVGGVDRVTQKPALPMLAPAGAKNITPVTTLVALAPAAQQAELIADLNGLTGGSYDDDPSVAAPVAFVSLVKAIEETLYLMKDLGVTEVVDQVAIVKEISSQMVEEDTVASLVAGTEVTVSSAVEQAIIDVLPVLEQNGTTAFSVAAGSETTFAAVVKAVALDVENVVASSAVSGTVTETETLLDAAQNVDTIIANDTNLVPIETIATSVVLNLDSVTLLDASGVETFSAGTATQVKVVLNAFNNTAATANYSDVSLTLSILDQSSLRSVVFKLAGVALSATPDADASVLGVVLDNATLTVLAKKSDGTQISTNSVSGAFELFDNNYGNNELLLNLDDVQNLFADQVAAEFASVNTVGNYTITLQATGAPVQAAAENVTIVP